MTDETNDTVQSLADRLRQERDELRVKLNLAGKEVRDEWEALESKWDGLRGRLDRLEDAADDAGDDIKAAAKLLAEEIRGGYEKIRRMI